MVDEVAKPAVLFRALKKRNAPAIGVVIGHTRTLGETTEAEGGIRGIFAIKAEQLTHGGSVKHQTG